jgi:hypothetical protein
MIRKIIIMVFLFIQLYKLHDHLPQRACSETGKMATDYSLLVMNYYLKKRQVSTIELFAI